MDQTITIPDDEIASDGLAHSLDLLKDTYNYNHWIYSLMRPFVGDRVLEIGSGCGNITRFLLDRDHVTCLEPLEEYMAPLGAIAATHRNVEVIQGLVENLQMELDSSQGFSTAICINVLEHIRDDGSALKLILESLEPGGRLLLYVPACQWAYGELDSELKHFRRYYRSDLCKLMKQQGFHIEHARYVNFVGAFGWWWSGRVRKEKVIDPKKARFVDRLVPYLSAVENLIPPVCGQSLYIVGMRPLE